MKTKKPLVGVVAFVEAFNEDGTDCSSAHSNTLRQLGATVESTFGEDCSHLIWHNGRSKRLKLAPLMDIKVVSPLWIEQCREAACKVPESDFQVDVATEAVAAVNAKEPVAAVSALRSIDSPHFSSSQREEKVKAERKKRKSATTESASSVSKKSSDAPIPVPNYKLATAETQLPRSKLARRRSERISDVYSESSGDEGPEVDDKFATFENDHVAASSVRRKRNILSSSDSEEDGTSETVGIGEKKRSLAKTKGAVSVNLPTLFVALVGFSSINGERETLESTLEAVFRLATSSGSRIVARGSDAEVVLEERCNLVIANSSVQKRSLAVLFALARGTPIVTEEWVYAALCSLNETTPPSSWPDFAAHRVVRYSQTPLGQPQCIFKDLTFFIGGMTQPAVTVAVDLISSAGGKFTSNLITSTCLLFGSSGDCDAWVSEHEDDRQSLGYQRAVKLASKRRVINFRYVCDCLEFGRLLHPAPDRHLMNIPTGSPTSGATPGSDRKALNKG